jgi:hypothetical protein
MIYCKIVKIFWTFLFSVIGGETWLFFLLILVELLNLFEPSFHNNLFCYNLLFQLKKNDKNCFKINSIRILFGFNGKNTLKSWKFEDLKKNPAKQLFFILNCTIYIWSVSGSRVLSIGDVPKDQIYSMKYPF